MTAVLDASALLAWLHKEVGAEVVDAMLHDALISSVNWAEVVQKAVALGIDMNGLRSDLEAIGLTIVPFSAEQAELSGMLWRETRAHGLSLGDRACLAMAIEYGTDVLTTDRQWGQLSLPVEVVVIR